MNDDLTKKLKQVAEMFTQDPDSLKGLLNALTQNNSEPKEEDHRKKTHVTHKDEASSDSDISQNLELISHMSKVMDHIRNHNDPRINLINAIKPFLSSKRQKKLGNCINMLHMSRLSKFFDDGNKQ